ncbi:double-strand break repair protein AddB [Pararhizobium sp.]|uniref:double-strand break repair protein AddB n=1 Tax=Pararhizobium sp. TaxID=1977563 RepID=UPI00271603BA|nr:double-strand break repair protein AddB [Pararhizobium sp.]MDO9416832.1 double-strand break repair protein AddB [Pararhizobium sp.]
MDGGGTERRNVFTIPAGVPFLKTLVESLCTGSLIAGFRYDSSDPLSLATTTIYVPTRRAARVLRSEFVDFLGGHSAILPNIRPLGETDDDSGYFDAETPAILDLAQPLSGPARLIELGRLILAWRNQLPKIVLDIHSGSPLVAPASPADAIWLARNLADLIDAMETEKLDWDRLKMLDKTEHAIWWQLTLEFLKIASVYWPDRLAELKMSSPARHRAAVIQAETERLAAGRHAGPIIIAGSTGSIPATAALIRTVADLENGAIVLPGLDQIMSDAEWAMVGARGSDGAETLDPSSRSHPQYGFHRLLARMKTNRGAIISLGQEEAAQTYRNLVMSQALLPVKATSGWSEFRQDIDAAALQTAFADVALIEAGNEREEATAIAIALRLALEEGGAAGLESQVALITPDRDLARRVSSELNRFGIEADDTAGSPLSSTPQGTLTRLLLEAALRPGDAVALVALLRHPLARFGLSATQVRAATDALELIALRGGIGVPDISALEPLLNEALARQAADRRIPEWRRMLPADAATQARDLAVRISAAVEPLAGALLRYGDGQRKTLSTSFTLNSWAERTGQALEAICADDTGNLAGLWAGEAGEALAKLLKGVIETDGDMLADGPQWADIVAALFTGEAIKPKAMSHPRVFIFGALEARLQTMDMVVLGGLNEGTWPDQTSNDPFLSRTMKTQIGLEPPERRIGQLAHDFQMACGNRKVILSRATRNGSTPTVASRWLQRLEAVGGAAMSKLIRKNGAPYLSWVQQLDQSPPQAPAVRPEPKPPAGMQPRSYSFSEVGRLRRDPYAIYARRILRLQPVDPFNRDPGASERGTLYHRIVERFVATNHGPLPENADEILRAILHEEFDREQLPLHIDVVWRPRFIAVAKAFLHWERARRPEIKHSYLEASASMPVGVGEVRLTGIADRIDLLHDGTAEIIDYKTGSNPSTREALTLLDPQLPLEAAALAGGGFAATGQLKPSSLTYVRLKPGIRFAVETINNENKKTRPDTPSKSASDLAADSLAEFRRLLELLVSGERGFASRLIVQREREYGGEYDHLARVAEWSTADAEEDGDEG